MIRYTVIPKLYNQYGIESLRLYEGDWSRGRPKASNLLHSTHALNLAGVRWAENKSLRRPVLLVKSLINHEQFQEFKKQELYGTATGWGRIARKIYRQDRTVFSMYKHLSKAASQDMLRARDQLPQFRQSLDIYNCRPGYRFRHPLPYALRDASIRLAGADFVHVGIHWSALAYQAIRPEYETISE